MRSFIPFHHVRSDFAFGKFSNALPELLLFFGKGKIHAALSPVIERFSALSFGNIQPKNILYRTGAQCEQRCRKTQDIRTNFAANLAFEYPTSRSGSYSFCFVRRARP